MRSPQMILGRICYELDSSLKCSDAAVVNFVMMQSKTSPTQSHLGRVRHYPRVRECTLPLHVLAVACTMCNKALWNIMEALWIDMEGYGTIVELLWNVARPLRKISILPITN